MAKKGGNQNWFKSRNAGWGWGMPQTWQGWVSFAVFLAVWVWALKTFLLPAGNSELSTSNLLAFIVIMIADVSALVYVSFKYGDAPKLNGGTKRAKRTTATKSKSNGRAKARPVRKRN